MKFRSIFLTLALGVTLSGCGSHTALESHTGDSQAAAPSPTEVVAPAMPPVTATPEVEELLPPTEETQPAEDLPEDISPEETPEGADFQRPTDREVLAAFREAEEAYGWFYDDPLELEGTPITLGDREYERVIDPRFQTLDSMRSYLKGVFSDEIVDALLPAQGGRYVDLDGALYASLDDWSAASQRSGLTLEVLWPEEGNGASCTVQATVDGPEGNAGSANGNDRGTNSHIYGFPYQKVGDKWVFTQFESIF